MATDTRRKEHTQDLSHTHQREAGRSALKVKSCTHQLEPVRRWFTRSLPIVPIKWNQDSVASGAQQQR